MVILDGLMVILRGSMAILRGSMVILDGLMVILDGSMVILDGLMVILDGLMVILRGSMVILRGSMVILCRLGLIPQKKGASKIDTPFTSVYLSSVRLAEPHFFSDYTAFCTHSETRQFSLADQHRRLPRLP